MDSRFLLCMWAFLTASFLFGQDGETSVFILPQEKGVIYNNEYNVDLRLNTNGYTLGFSRGKIKTYYKTNTIWFDATLHKHPKEFRQNNKVIFPSTGESSTPFIYGKTNSLYTFKAGKGIKKYWTDKAARKGVLIGYIAEGGVTLGVMQPYYLKVATLDEQTGLIYLKEIKYEPGTEETFLDQSRIFGRGPIFKGIFESDLIPGIHGQFGIHCDYGRYDSFIKAIEVGVMANVFTKSIDLMYGQPKRPYLLNFYLAVQFGKRY